MNLIAVAVNEEESIAGHFVSCRGFEVFQVENESIVKKEFRQGPSGEDTHADHHSEVVELLKDCKAVICGGMGHRVAAVFINQGIIPLVAANADNASEAVRLFVKGELRISQPHRCCHDQH